MLSRAVSTASLLVWASGCVATAPPASAAVETTHTPNGPSAAAPSVELSTNVQPLAFGQVVDGVPCTEETPLGQHLHVHLQVLHDGTDVPIPVGIGVGRPWQIDASGFLLSGSCFAWIHVHDDTGVIHVVAPMGESFSLGQVFEVWGEPLAADAALTYRGPIETLVNGQQYEGDPATLTLANLQNIVLVLGEPPASYPPALFDFAAVRD